jgi:hypothetical protein
MDYAFFEKLTVEDAGELLDGYLRAESAACAGLVERATAAGVVADFTAGSVPAVMTWVFASIGSVPLKPDPQAPDWIRNSAPYLASLFNFDDLSNQLIMATSYYVGESFVRSFPDRLRWSTGDTEFALQNQPVVAGFTHSLELSPIVVTESLFSRAIKDPTKVGDIDRAVRYWLDKVPRDDHIG